MIAAVSEHLALIWLRFYEPARRTGMIIIRLIKEADDLTFCVVCLLFSFQFLFYFLL